VRDHGSGRTTCGGADGSGRGPFNRVYLNTFGLRRDEEGTRAIFFRLSSHLSPRTKFCIRVYMYIRCYTNALGRLGSKMIFQPTG